MMISAFLLTHLGSFKHFSLYTDGQSNWKGKKFNASAIIPISGTSLIVTGASFIYLFFAPRSLSWIISPVIFAASPRTEKTQCIGHIIYLPAGVTQISQNFTGEAATPPPAEQWVIMGEEGASWMIAAAIRDEIAGGMMCLYDKNMKYVKCMHAKWYEFYIVEYEFIWYTPVSGLYNAMEYLKRWLL